MVKVSKKQWIDITPKCKAKLDYVPVTIGGHIEDNKDLEALVYISYKKEKVGLFDKSGFHYMYTWPGYNQYKVVSFSKPVINNIRWFKIYLLKNQV